jgi:serine/threonine-protein kinase
MLLRTGEGRPLQTWGLNTPPEVQQVRATELLRRFGLPEQPFRITGFEEKGRYHAWVYVNDHTKTKWDRFRRGLPRVSFWLREQPKPVLDLRTGAASLRPERLQPPLTPGSSAIEIDLRGRLISLQAVPTESSRAHAPDWNGLLDAAGLRGAALVSAEPKLTPTVFADARAAWNGKHPDDGTPIRVEAAAWRGVPVLFRIIAPWDEKDLSAQVPFGGGGFSGFLRFVGLTAIIVGAVLAWRNIRLRRGDRPAAVRIGLAIFLLNLAAQLIWVKHEPVFEHELALVKTSLAFSLFSATVFALLYIAVEPYVRQRWPDRLISWARLVAGKWRDPMIGRDVLIGLIGGALHAVLAAYSPKLAVLAKGQPAEPFTGRLELLGIPAAGVAGFFDSVMRGMVFGLVLMTMLMVLTIILRRRWLAILAFYSIAFTAFLFASTELWLVPLFGAMAAIYTVVVTRYGLLATAAMQTAFFSFYLAPYPDAFAWYTARGLVTPVLVLALAVWAFFTSLGGQRAFAANLLDG